MARDRRAAGRPVRRDGGPDRGDRPVGAGPEGPLALLQPHRGGQQLRHPLPATGGPGRGGWDPRSRIRAGRGPAAEARERRTPSPRTSRSCWTRTYWPRGTSTSPSGTSRSAPTTAGWRTRPTPPAGSATPCASSTWPPVRRRPRPSTTPPTAWPGPTTTPPSSTCGWTRPCAPTSSGGTGSAPIRPPTPWSTRRRTTASTWGWAGPRTTGTSSSGLDSKVTSEFRALSADEPEGDFSVIEPRRQGIEYSVDHDRGDPAGGRAGRFLIVTNDGAEDFRLMEAPDDSPGRAYWREVIPARPGVQAGQRRPLRRPPGGLRAGGRRDPGPGDRRRLGDVHAPWSGRSRPPRCGAGPTPSTSPPPSATSTPRWSPPAPSTTSTSTSGGSALLKRQPVLGDFDPAATGPSGGGPWPATGPRSPCRWSTDPTWWAMPVRRRAGAVPALRLRLLRGVHRPDLLLAAAEPARPGVRLRHRPRPGRRRDGPDLVRGGQVRGQAQHLHRLRGLRPHPDRRGMDHARTSWWPGEAAPAAC